MDSTTQDKRARIWEPAYESFDPEVRRAAMAIAVLLTFLVIVAMGIMGLVKFLN